MRWFRQDFGPYIGKVINQFTFKKEEQTVLRSFKYNEVIYRNVFGLNIDLMIDS